MIDEGAQQQTFWQGKLAFVLALAFLALVAWIPRSVSGLMKERADDAGWFSRDPDGLYHVRRVARALDEGAVAETDPRMNFPEGAAIPWPPYYDRALSWALAPFAPSGAERWMWLERAVSSAPRLFGVATVLLAAFAAWRLGGIVAALVAGLGVALCRGTINYSVVGTGDHHAWIALLAAATFALASEAARNGALDSPGRGALRGALFGAAIGVAVGLMIGSWVASLLFLVIPLQLIFAAWLFWRGRAPLPGLAPLGFSAHLVAALVLLPAVLSSPWRAEFPWMVVNLSWFHLAHLALGALVFVPLLLRGASTFAANTKAARSYPFAVAIALGGLAAAAWALDLAPARGIADGFAWASRADAFMDAVQESAPLVGPRAESGVLFFALGYGVLALPLCLGWLSWRAVRERKLEYAAWIVAAAWLVGWALVQRRFADPLAAPMSVVLGLGAAQLARWRKPALVGPALCVLAAAANAGSITSAWRVLSQPDPTPQQRAYDVAVGEREALEWIRERSQGDDAWSVLSHWDRGHVLEWVANAPSIATNFGSYIGVESYRAPPRFFLAEDPAAADEILARRRVRYVYAPASLVNVLRSQIRVADPALAASLLANGAPSVRYWKTMAGRLLSGGAAVGPDQAWIDPSKNSLANLRLVHVTRERNSGVLDPRSRQPLPVGFVWEHVPGALLEAHGPPGALLEVSLQVDYASSGYGIAWRRTAVAGEDGVARIRCPYATDASNGDGVVRNASCRWADAATPLSVPTRAVLEGLPVRIRG